jgi:site-specific DNA recombinase
MWMGGVAPLGYDVKDKQLIVNPHEANVVREIFDQYLSLGSVAALKQYLDRRKLRTKLRTSADGQAFGGKPYSRDRPLTESPRAAVRRRVGHGSRSGTR